MELTKAQIKHIDHRLEQEGIIYWDIRIEMLDHVVSDIEKKLKPTHTEYQFKELVLDSFILLGWKENFNGGGFEKVFQRILTDYSKRNKNSSFSYYKQLFTNLKYLTINILFWLYLLVIHPHKQLFKYSMLLVLLIFMVAFIGFVFKYKVFKSTRLSNLLFLVFTPLTLINVFMFWPKTFFGYEKLSLTYLYVVCGITIPFLVFGVYFLYKEFRKTEKVYKKLIS